MNNEDRARELYLSRLLGNRSGCKLDGNHEEVVAALDAAEARGRGTWAEEILVMVATIEDKARAQAISDCIAALNKLIDEMSDKEFHPDTQQALFLARDALEALLAKEPSA